LQSAQASACGEILRVRRTLAGALVTVSSQKLVVERAPARKTPGPSSP
jgi:hypothetical protein